MEPKMIKEGVYWAGAVDWDRRLFDGLIPLPDGTSYNAYIVKGSAKTALIDTVDPSRAAGFLKTLEHAGRIDYIVSNHAEQDHSGAIPLVLERYPEAKVLASPKGRQLLAEHLGIPLDRIEAVNDGDRIDLGGKTLEAVHAPWVHWPETMLTYLAEDRIFFTCDLFGSHLAFAGLYEDDTGRLVEAAKRYYAEVMMPFRELIGRYIARMESRRIELIAPSHGPVIRQTASLIEAHRSWVADEPVNKAIIAYASMHGSTEEMASCLIDSLVRKGIAVVRFNLASYDLGRFAMELVDAATAVIGTPTVLGGAHPSAATAAFVMNSLRPKLRFLSMFGSYGWSGRALDEMKQLTRGLKAELLEPVFVKGRPGADAFASIEMLAVSIAVKHREAGLLKESVAASVL